jgi:FkbM family methyltransferase
MTPRIAEYPESSRRPWRYQGMSGVKYKAEEDFPPRIRLLKWLGRQVWVPRGQDRLLRALYDPDGGEHFYFDIDFFGQRYHGDLGHFIDWMVFCYGAAPYSEVMLLRDLVSYLRDRAVTPISFYDIGANVGHHSLFMASLADRVYAVEPYGDLIHLIKEKIEANKLVNITILPFALGESDSKAAYFPGTNNPGAGSLFNSFPGVSPESTDVDVRHGDRTFGAMKLPKIDVMKIDVQGFEPQVIRGLKERIARDRPAVLMEMSDHSRDGFGREDQFRALFYPDAAIVEITGRYGRPYKLQRFSYEIADEVLILPPEMADFLAGKV